MKITDLHEGQSITYAPSGALVTVDSVSPWNVTLRNHETGASVVVSNPGLSLYNA